MTVSLCQHMSVLLVLTGGLVSFHVTDSMQGFTPILNNSGPAVVGSNVTFHAVLYGCNDTSVNLSQFTYVWMSTAQTVTNKQSTKGGCSSQISQLFANNMPGLYTMSVMVQNRTEWLCGWVIGLCIKGTPAGLATTVFNLTGELNGDLVLKHVNQSPHVHLTHTSVYFGVNITDQIANATFTYTWHANGTETTTYTPSFNYTFHVAGWHTVEVLVNMSTSGTQGVNSTRYGVFQKRIQLKDAVSKLSYSGNRMFPVGSFIQANVSWSGSAPFRLSWSLHGAGYTRHSPTIIVPRHTASLEVPLHRVGDFLLTTDVVNDWSASSKEEKITVFKPDPGTSVSLVLLCIVIGIAVVTATGIAYRRDRQLTQRHLEVADFSFHSHATTSSSVGHCVAALRLKWRRLWISRASQDVHMHSYDRL